MHRCLDLVSDSVALISAVDEELLKVAVHSADHGFLTQTCPEESFFTCNFLMLSDRHIQDTGASFGIVFCSALGARLPQGFNCPTTWCRSKRQGLHAPVA